MTDAQNNRPDVRATDAKTPKQLAREWAAMGIKVSERTLRARIRQLGCYRTVGKAMFLLPEDVAALLEGLKPEQPSAPRRTDHSSLGDFTIEDALALHAKLEAEQKRKRRRTSR